MGNVMEKVRPTTLWQYGFMAQAVILKWQSKLQYTLNDKIFYPLRILVFDKNWMQKITDALKLVSIIYQYIGCLHFDWNHYQGYCYITLLSLRYCGIADYVSPVKQIIRVVFIS